MNRILLSFLVVSVLITPVFSQEKEGVPVKPGPELPGTTPGEDLFWESDTVHAVQGTDSLKRSRRSHRVQADSLVVPEPDFSHSPSKAIMFALVLPGMGQAYNHKYYKMPIVWAALGAAGYAISYNTKNYKQASQDYAFTPDDTNERYLRFWRRNLELSYIGLMAVYALQVLDAYVDAQLYSWNVNDNLSLRVAPSLQPLMTPNSLTGQAYGLTCSIKLKR